MRVDQLQAKLPVPKKADPKDADISKAPEEIMQEIRLASSFLSNAGGAMPMNANGASWNMDFVTTSGNVIVDLLHNFHLRMRCPAP